MKLSVYRRIAQIIFFLLFLYLLNRTEYTGTQELKYPVKLFLDIDPLIALTTFLTTHTIPLLLWLSLFTVILTAVFGRFFCGFVCPMGSLNHFFSWLFSKIKPSPKRGLHAPYQKSKYVILFVMLGSSLAGLHLAGFLDPISLLIRSFTVGILPVTSSLARSVIYPVLGSDLPFVEKYLLAAYPQIKQALLSHEQTYYWQGFLIAFIFFGIIFLNLVRNRFFCRVLCPLGALLGTVSKYSIIELDQSDLCNSCSSCVATSQGGASPHEKGKWMKSECILCFNCVDTCNLGSLKFRFNIKAARKKGEIDLSRRSVMASLFAGIFAAPFVKLSPRKIQNNPSLIRPPGALAEEEFLKRCVKCEECMKVCLTNVIQPAFMQSGFEGIWTPYLDMKSGYCEYNCNLCGQVCPTEAIVNLPLEKKKRVKIGQAFVDMNRCLPFAFDIPCLVCEEHCPTSPKAIVYEEIVKKNRRGDTVVLRGPRVLENICIGCGICQNKCPVSDKPAIYVTSINEHRSIKNRMLLNENSLDSCG